MQQSLQELAKQSGIDVKEAQPWVDAGTSPEIAVGAALDARRKSASPVGLFSTQQSVNSVMGDKQKLDQYAPPTPPQTNQQSQQAKPQQAEKPKEPQQSGVKFSFEEASQIFGNDFTGIIQGNDGNFYADPKAMERIGVQGMQTQDTKQTTLENEEQTATRNLESLESQFASYNVNNDPDLAPVVQDIKNKYAKLKTDMQDVNKRREAAYKTLNIRLGTQQYAGKIAEDIVEEELTQASERIAELERLEAQEIVEAKADFKAGRYEEFSKKIDILEKQRDRKTKELEKYSKALVDLNKKVTEEKTAAKKQEIQASRDSAITDLYSQGITDIPTMLDYLNYDESGRQIGDFTADEVSKVLKLFEHKDELAGLTPDFKTFTYLQQNSPEELKAMGVTSYRGYLQAIEEAKQKPGKQGTDLVLDLIQKYPDAGILITDSLGVAQSKIQQSRIYQQQTRLASGGSGKSGSSGGNRQIESTIEGEEEIEVDPTVESYAQNIISGFGSLSSVPKEMKDAVNIRLQELQKAGTTKSVKLTAAQQEDMATMDTVNTQLNELLAYNADGKLEGVGFGTGPLGSLTTKIFGTGSEESKSVKALISNIKGTIAKLRGGTSFTENEEKLLNSYVPTINESGASVINKIINLQSFIEEKRSNLLQAAQPQKVGPTKTGGTNKDELRKKYNY